MNKHFIVLKDFDKHGTVYFDLDNTKDSFKLFSTCVAAAPWWLEVVSLNGPTKESAFSTYCEYTPTKEVNENELVECCINGSYDFGEWLFGKEPERKGWKYNPN